MRPLSNQANLINLPYFLIKSAYLFPKILWKKLFPQTPLIPLLPLHQVPKSLIRPNFQRNYDNSHELDSAKKFPQFFSKSTIKQLWNHEESKTCIKIGQYLSNKEYDSGQLLAPLKIKKSPWIYPFICEFVKRVNDP